MSNLSPTKERKAVAYWLLICCGLVFAMVVLGGVTRLTGSGLSMVDWRPLLGWLPPIGDSEWERVFTLYQQSPEYRLVNSHMDVHAFKSIFWLEYLHRLLGRLIGLVFFIPFVFFLVTKRIRRSEWGKYASMFVLGGLQGVLGWYMVKSGLVDNPHVSQYRLTAHLVAAFLIYAFMFWVALSLLYPVAQKSPHRWFRPALLVTGLVSVTIISGGFVAGLKAGKIFNNFPKMGDGWLPPGGLSLSPLWRNIFENTATVQFNHRVLAITTFVCILVFFLKSRRAVLPGRASRATKALLHTSVLQVALGITTLVLAVPIILGAIHQAVAMLLFTVSLYLTHSLWRA